MFRLPSVSYILDEAKKSALRFPSVILFSAVSAAVSFHISEGANDLPHFEAVLLFTTTLGIPLFLAIGLYCEKPIQGFQIKSIWLNVLGLFLLTAYFLFERNDLTHNFFDFYFQLSLSAHLLVACVAFLSHGETNGFWQFNKSLFLRAVITTIYAAVLCLGLFAALAAINFLFDAKISSKSFIRIWILISFVFQTWFFVGGVPKDIKSLEGQSEYPHALKIFNQYILIPLVSLYLLILYAYMIKILGTWNWPKGLVVWIVSGVSILGILALLMIYPLQKKKENAWMYFYGRFFYLALIPLLAMGLLAVLKRIDQYGITERRYFLIVLCFWFFCLAIYFTFSKAKSIKIIPISLLGGCLATSFGPWGAYTVSRKSQLVRLEKILVQNNLLTADGVIVRASKQVPFADSKQMSAIFDYIINNHGRQYLEAYVDDVALSAKVTKKPYSRSLWGMAYETSEALMNSLGLDYVGSSRATTYFNFSTSSRVANPQGYDYVVEINTIDTKFSIDKTEYYINTKNTFQEFELGRIGQSFIKVSLEPLILKLLQWQNLDRLKVPPEAMTVEGENQFVKFKFYFRHLSGYEDVQSRNISGSGLLLLKVK